LTQDNFPHLQTRAGLSAIGKFLVSEIERKCGANASVLAMRCCATASEAEGKVRSEPMNVDPTTQKSA
jgi:hypothetical protein